MKNALNNSVPADLFTVYETVMDSIRNSDDSGKLALKIFSWILYAKRPLQMLELREAIAIREGDTGLNEDDLMSDDEIVELCGSLVSFDASGVVTFSHITVQEFLKLSHWSELLDESVIAKACLIYILFDVFEEGFGADEASFTQRLHQSPFAQYAARYWGAHVKEGKTENDAEIEQLLIRLSESSKKIDSLSQLYHGNGDAAWELDDLFRHKTLLHLLAENGLTILMQTALSGKLGKVFFQ